MKVCRSALVCPKCGSKDLELRDKYLIDDVYTQRKGLMTVHSDSDVDRLYSVGCICAVCEHTWKPRQVKSGIMLMVDKINDTEHISRETFYK